jgi:hypothetical protein
LLQEIIYAIAMVMAWLGVVVGNELRPSLALMLCFHKYLRPGELARLMWRHITMPSRSTPQTASVVLHPLEEEIPSKVSEFDETMIIDDKALIAALAHLWPKWPGPGDTPVTGVDMARFTHLFHRAQNLLLLPRDLGVQQMYVFRHSGASADWITNRRSRQAINDRGRWASDSSLRRYQKGGRVAEQFNRCSPDLQRYALHCLTSLPTVLRGQVRASRPPFLVL